MSRYSPLCSTILRVLLLAAVLCCVWPAGAWAEGAKDGNGMNGMNDASGGAAIQFGILPIGGLADSSEVWRPLLAELSRHIGRPIVKMSVASYSMMAQAIARGQVDMAFVSGELALEAVTRHGFVVIAQVYRHDGLPGYRATLLARQGGPVRDLQAVLAAPGKWRLARGEKQSLSGFIVPKLELFLPRGIDIETGFQGEIVGTHQRTALAVVNDDADLATGNTADFERFAVQFPDEAARLKVVWQSELIPHGVIVLRRSHGAAQRQPMRDFLAGYGRGDGKQAEHERAVLKDLHDFAGFLPASNQTLTPIANLVHKLNLDSAQHSRWIDETARQAHLQHIERDYAEQLRALSED
jgi:phosphonate transport system substrate-binding protein